MTWKEHVKINIKDINIKLKKMYWIVGWNFELVLKLKLLLYNAVINQRELIAHLFGVTHRYVTSK